MKVVLKALFSLLIIIFPLFHCVAQTIKFSNAGVNVGLSFNVGSTTNRVGLSVGAFYYYNFVQLNTTLRTYYNFSTFGPSLKGFELQPSIGALAAFGDYHNEVSEFYYSLGNQTGKKYALGYSLNFYFDQIETTQRTGTILIGIDRVEIIHENDILATQRSDRFRTGGIKITYQKDNMLFAISSILWTGNPQSQGTVKIRDSEFPSRFGYVDFSKGSYGKYSNGILALQFKHVIGFGQGVQVSAGIDSEIVRNVFQNRIIHDMYFWPKKWNKARNPHLPMLDDQGNPYLYMKDQKIKAPSFYWDVSLNPSVFY